MQVTLLREDIPIAEEFQQEYQELCAWAAESRSTNPFVFLALHWHAGHLTIAEGRRIETDQQLAQFLQRRMVVTWQNCM